MKTQIDTIRAQIATAKAERAALQSQPRSRQDARAAVTECIEGLAAEARARAERALRRVAAGESPRTAVLAVFGRTDPAINDTSVDAVGLVALLGVEAVAGTLLASLDAVVPEGMSDDARAQRSAALDAEIEQLEPAGRGHLDRVAR